LAFLYSLDFALKIGVVDFYNPCFWAENGGGFEWGIWSTLDIELKTRVGILKTPKN